MPGPVDPVRRTGHRGAVAPHPSFDPNHLHGLEPGATRADVRRAYRRRALAIHPDVAAADATAADATAEMTLLNRARDELLARAPVPGRAATAPPDPRGDPATRPKPRPERETPAGTQDHESAWADHWSAWNELPRRR
jgi:molecular chaperone DnaJ